MTLAEIKEILGRHTLVGQRDTHEILEALLGHLEAQERHIEMMDERLRLQTGINAEFMRILGVEREPEGWRDPEWTTSSSTNETP